MEETRQEEEGRGRRGRLLDRGVFPRMLCNPISSFMNWRDLTGWIESFNWMFDEIEGRGRRGMDIKGNFISYFFPLPLPYFSSRFVFRYEK